MDATKTFRNPPKDWLTPEMEAAYKRGERLRVAFVEGSPYQITWERKREANDIFYTAEVVYVGIAPSGNLMFREMAWPDTAPEPFPVGPRFTLAWDEIIDVEIVSDDEAVELLGSAAEKHEREG